MAVVRFQSTEWGAYDSDLYIFFRIGGGIECCGCCLEGADGTFVTDTIGQMVQHVRDHIGAGHRVPKFVIPNLHARRM